MDYKAQIRFVLTNQCNSNCIFCHNEGIDKKEKIDFLATPDDYQFICKVAEELGIKKFVLTGGEPLLHPRVFEIARAIKNKNNILNLVTNGFLLEEKAVIADIADEIHVSLPSLNRSQYAKIMGVNFSLERVLAGISAVETKTNLIISTVMLKEYNHDLDNIRKIIALADKCGAGVYLIEVYPKGAKGYLPVSEIERLIVGLGYKRVREAGLKIIYEKKGLPRIYVVVLPCAFVASHCRKSQVDLCKSHQSIYLLPSLEIVPCFHRPDERINLYQEVKNRDAKGLAGKIEMARKKIGRKCPLVYSGA